MTVNLCMLNEEVTTEELTEEVTTEFQKIINIKWLIYIQYDIIYEIVKLY